MGIVYPQMLEPRAPPQTAVLRAAEVVEAVLVAALSIVPGERARWWRGKSDESGRRRLHVPVVRTLQRLRRTAPCWGGALAVALTVLVLVSGLHWWGRESALARVVGEEGLEALRTMPRWTPIERISEAAWVTGQRWRDVGAGTTVPLYDGGSTAVDAADLETNLLKALDRVPGVPCLAAAQLGLPVRSVALSTRSVGDRWTACDRVLHNVTAADPAQRHLSADGRHMLFAPAPGAEGRWVPTGPRLWDDDGVLSDGPLVVDYERDGGIVRCVVHDPRAKVCLWRLGVGFVE